MGEPEVPVERVVVSKAMKAFLLLTAVPSAVQTENVAHTLHVRQQHPDSSCITRFGSISQKQLCAIPSSRQECIARGGVPYALSAFQRFS